jgi:hypothetical protein
MDNNPLGGNSGVFFDKNLIYFTIADHMLFHVQVIMFWCYARIVASLSPLLLPKPYLFISASFSTSLISST